MFTLRKWFPFIYLLSIVMAVSLGCRGIRRDMSATPTPAENASAAGKGWVVIPLAVTQSAAGDLRVDLAVENDTGLWSTLAAADLKEKPSTVTTADGKSVPCDVVEVGSGGHYIPPGFRFKGYVNKKGETVPLHVECKGAGSSSGAKLTIPYTYIPGEYDYYAQEKGKTEGKFEVGLDKTTSDLTFPVASVAYTAARAIDEPFSTLNKTTLSNSGVTRTDDGITFKWKVVNPGEYDTKVHVGTPPVLGNDGIIYGARVSPDIVDQPFSPPKGEVEFETQVAVPRSVSTLYLLLSVEETRERLFSNYLIDLTNLK